MPKYITPNELQRQACIHMLEGRSPKSLRDWNLCANFWAANVEGGLEVELTKIMGRLFECPLEVYILEEVAKFQQRKKKEKV